jgi:hypothetical protein
MKYSLRSLMTFSIRDLALVTVIVALVTVIVALVLGWWVREGQLASELARAKRWRNAAGTLEQIVRSEGWDVRWQIDSHHPFDSQSGVEISRPGEARWSAITSSNEPSQDQSPQTSGKMPGLPNASAPAPNPPQE